MAALVVVIQTDRTLVLGTDQEVAAANVNRVTTSLKNIGTGTVWIKLATAASVTDGWPIRPGGELHIGSTFGGGSPGAQGVTTDNWQGTIHAIWDGDGSQARQPYATTGRLRVVELDNA